MLSCRKGRKGTPRGRVKDGTRCNVDPMIKDVCIEGICKVKKNIFKRGHKAQSKAETRHAGRGARGSGQGEEGTLSVKRREARDRKR